MKKLLIAMFVLGAAAPVAAQPSAFASGAVSGRFDVASMNVARELYASARYDEALVLLNNLKPRDASQPGELKLIEQYRSLCLLALGRGEEAETAIAAVVTADPFFAPTESEASPRVRSAFSDVRTKLLPGIVTARYAAAKQAYERKEHAVAEKMFRELMTLLDDQQMNGRLPDLRMLVAGFIDLSAAAATPPSAAPEPKVEAAKPATPAPPAAPRVYTGDEPGIVLPMTIRQEVPKLPVAIQGMTKDRGVLDLTIDEQGRVALMSLRSSIHPMYDTLLLNAAREWRYRPATLNGVPVRFRKVLQISLSATR